MQVALVTPSLMLSAVTVATVMLRPCGVTVMLAGKALRATSPTALELPTVTAEGPVMSPLAPHAASRASLTGWAQRVTTPVYTECRNPWTVVRKRRKPSARMRAFKVNI